MKRKSRFNFVNILIIGIMIWCVSASYSYYLAGRQPSHASSYYGAGKIGVFDKIAAMFAPELSGITARAAVVVDAETGEMVYSKNENDKLPIASLTKLASACVMANSDKNLNQYLTIAAADLSTPGKTRLRQGETIRLIDLLYLSLMRSDNIATMALSRSLEAGTDSFVRKMNELAQELKMFDTEFADPTGLDSGNRSTARDMVKLLYYVRNHEVLGNIISKKIYKFEPLGANSKYTLYNTNRLLFSRWKVQGGKTGYISQAGYCLAFTADLYDEREVIAVLLGSSSNRNRYRDADYLLALASE